MQLNPWILYLLKKINIWVDDTTTLANSY